MSTPDDIWIPLVDEPIGGIVEQIQRENPEIGKLVESPNRVLAFRTFAYIRVGLLLGQLLFDADLPPYDGSGTCQIGTSDPKRICAARMSALVLNSGPSGESS